MNTARIGFGCAVDNYGEYIYVVGGTVGKKQLTDECEAYSLTQN